MLLIKSSSIGSSVKPRNIIKNKAVMKIILLLIVLVMEIRASNTNEFQSLTNIGPSKLLQLHSHSGLPNFRPVFDHPNKNSDNKRSWQGLQGSWGKRFKNVVDINLEHFDETSNLLNDSDELDSENSEVNKNNINYSEVYRLLPTEGDLVRISVPKRAWKNMNSGWGKRRSTNNDWNKFRGSWGKREPAWNNLKGLWGKRSENWNKLQLAWGKRHNN